MSYAYLFPGQGSQEVGMGRDAYLRSSAARETFDEADALFGFPFSDLIFYGPEEQLTDTANQQPALFITSMAHWRAAIDEGWPRPRYLAGHSLGEISALAASGALSFADGLSLVRERGRLMKTADESEPGGMAAILALDVTTVQDLCAAASEESGQPVQIANDNCPGQIVISGHELALVQAMDLARQAGARKVVRLPITIAAHSDLMSSASQRFAIAVDATPFREPDIPVVGNVTALPLKSVDDIRRELKAQLTSPVAWTGSMQYLLEQGVKSYIEVGPGKVLLGLVKRIDRKSRRIEFDLDHAPLDL
jgi:[acyl-carrier-protein] S-malonyltransferase